MSGLFTLTLGQKVKGSFKSSSLVALKRSRDQQTGHGRILSAISGNDITGTGISSWQAATKYIATGCRSRRQKYTFLRVIYFPIFRKRSFLRSDVFISEISQTEQ